MGIISKSFLFLFVGLFVNSKTILESNKNNSPNFIVILVDDQGWNGTSVQM
jgi:hypothetical protein